MFHPIRQAVAVLTGCVAFLAIMIFVRDSQLALAAGAPAVVPASADNWGLSFPAEGEAPVGNATAADLEQYGAYYLGDTSKKVIYLTFDCGYENGYTNQILDTLQKHQAPAAFFVVGHMIESAPEIVRRMVEEGHTLGNPTYSHPDLSAIADEASFREELEQNEALYRQVTGQEMAKLYRPPQGKFCESNLRMAQQLGYRTVFWSLAYVDWYEEEIHVLCRNRHL